MIAVDRSDERPHPPGDDPAWEESWTFDFAGPQARHGGSIRVARRPGERRASCWAVFVEAGAGPVVVRDDELALPRRGGLAVRGEGVWGELTCETPGEHWSIGLEAFAVQLDDPGEAFRGERGTRVALGFDWEFEARRPPRGRVDGPDAGGYGQFGAVHGEVLLGDRAVAIDGVGWRSHEWGARDWTEPRTRAWLTDLEARRPVVVGTGRMDEGGGEATELTVVAPAPLLVGRARLHRALCRSDDGRVGWTETLEAG